VEHLEKESVFLDLESECVLIQVEESSRVEGKEEENA
tara:strand:- start:247 stop:357 length:111 start_codon:yes stop_codon:yes gene_type:complete